MTSKSPLLQLQEYNTDVWEMVMIELVKTRMKYVMNYFKELCNRCCVTVQWFSQGIHSGRKIIRKMIEKKLIIKNI